MTVGMSDRRDFVTRAKRHERKEWSRGAGALANGIELDRIQERRSRMTDSEREAERAQDEAADAAERRRLDARAARRAAIRPRCEVCEVSAASEVVIDGMRVCESCAGELA